MSETNDTSKLGHGTSGPELTEAELDAVGGGFLAVEYGAIGGRTGANGRTDVIKVMGNTKSSDIELRSH
jgi:hypothetical protein